MNAADLSAGANQVSFQDTGVTVQSDDTIDVTIADAVDFDFLANTFRALSGSAFNADTINETTSAAGVTVDGVLLKDGGMTLSALTAGRVVFAGTGGLLTDDADFTFATDTMTVTKIAATSFTGAVDFTNQAVTNVGAAGNDFGASNSLVATTFSGDVSIGANLLKTTNLALKEFNNDKFILRDDGDTNSKGIILTTITYDSADGLFSASNVDGRTVKFNARDSGVGQAEVARLQGAADPYFQATLPMLFTPIATASLPATPVEGMFTYDATLDLLTYRDVDSWETITPIKYGEAHIAAGGALTIDTTAEWHAITGMTVDVTNGVSFNAGSTAAITAYADASGGQVTVTSNGHGLSNGDIVTIAGSTNYNGIFEIANVATNTFEITDTWVADDGAGTWRNGSNFVTDTAGIYKFDWFLSATSANANNTFAYAIAIDATIQTNGKQRRKYATNTDVGTTAGSFLVDASAGGIVTLNAQNEGAANNITINELTANITRVG